MALICLLLCGGVNAWATIYTWQVPTTLSGENDYTDYNGTFGQRYSNQDVKIPDVPIYYLLSNYHGNSAYDKTYHGLKISWVGYASSYLKSTEDGYVQLSIERVKHSSYADSRLNNLWIGVYDENGTLITRCTPGVVQTSRGTGNYMFFKMDAGKYYKIEGSIAGRLKKIIFYTTDEITSIVLDENDSNEDNQDAIPSSITTDRVYVSIKRTLKSGQWNTFCLPVGMSSSFMSECFGCNSVYEMNNYSSGGGEGNLTFTSKSNLTAGNPCLIKVPFDVVNPTFITTNKTTAKTPATVSPSSGSGIKFTGVYGTENIYTSDNQTFFMDSEGYLLYPTSNDGTIKGFRAYFQWANASVKNLSFTFDGTETGIKMVDKDIFQENGNVYSIDGRFVGNSTENLTRGIYIQNGRKFVVK